MKYEYEIHAVYFLQVALTVQILRIFSQQHHSAISLIWKVTLKFLSENHEMLVINCKILIRTSKVTSMK